MADVTGAKVDWQNVSAADYEANNANAVNNRLTAARLNALGQAIRNVNDALGGGDVAPRSGSVRFVKGNASVSRGTAATDVCVIFLVPGATAPVNAISGLDIWMRTV